MSTEMALKSGVEFSGHSREGPGNSGLALDGRRVLPGNTLAEKFHSAVQERGSAVALRQKNLGVWKEITWTQLGQQVRDISMGLVALGFQVGDTASILSNTRWEWTAADYGILCAGGVSSGIYPTDAASQVEFLCADSGSSIVFVEDDEQLDKVLQVQDGIPGLKKVIVFDFDGLAKLDHPLVLSFQALQQLGASLYRTQPQVYEQRLRSRKLDDLAILVYTSGTTGKPKGAMISNRNVRWQMENAPLKLSQRKDDDKMAFLPLCHIAERMFGQFLALETGARSNYVENPETIAENVREIAPTVLLAVPRVWEKFYSGVAIRLKDATAFQQAAYKLAIGIGFKVADAKLTGRTPGVLDSIAYTLARWLVLNNVRRMIGVHRVRFAVTGAAPIAPELIRWYHALGVDLYELWGMTETTGGGTTNLPGACKLGSIGQATPACAVKIADDGEIMVKGANVFMGYLNQPEKTRETINEDGWLHTGDVGTVDEHGFFRIVDRKKDIIITAGGKNITPSELENELKFSPFITDAVVVGDRRAFLTCLIMIDHENVEKYAQDRSVPFSNFASLCRTREVQALVQAEIDRVNAKFARVEQIKKFALIEQKLTAEDEELTPTMKLKRKLVNEKYKDLIDSMYR